MTIREYNDRETKRQAELARIKNEIANLNDKVLADAKGNYRELISKGDEAKAAKALDKVKQHEKELEVLKDILSTKEVLFKDLRVAEAEKTLVGFKDVYADALNQTETLLAEEHKRRLALIKKADEMNDAYLATRAEYWQIAKDNEINFEVFLAPIKLGMPICRPSLTGDEKSQGIRTKI